MSGFHHHSFYRYPIENPPNLADTGKKHYICIRNQERNLPVTSFIYGIHISHTICGERLVCRRGITKRTRMKWKAMIHVLRSNSIPHPLFHFLPQTLAFALGLYYLYGRIDFIFRRAERTFRLAEHTFQRVEYTFRLAEYKTKTTDNRL